MYTVYKGYLSKQEDTGTKPIIKVFLSGVRLNKFHNLVKGEHLLRKRLLDERGGGGGGDRFEKVLGQVFFCCRALREQTSTHITIGSGQRSRHTQYFSPHARTVRPISDNSRR